MTQTREGFTVVDSIGENMLFRILWGNGDTLPKRHGIRAALRTGRIDTPSGTWRRRRAEARWIWEPKAEADQ